MKLGVVGAFAVVYIVWGSTYLGIDLAIESMPPLWMAGLRFLAAGGLMVAWARYKKTPWPSLPEFVDAVFVGFLMLALGNGALSIVETKMPIGFAALLIATVSLWLVGFEALQLRAWPSKGVMAGLAVGIVGVGLLAGVDAGWEGDRVDPWFVALMLAGSAAWAYGSLYSRRSKVAMSMRVGMQMIGGAAGLFLGALIWEPTLDIAGVTASSWWALIYLITAGSILAFTCYIWLLGQVSAAAVGTYAFVNPIVAMLLGAWFLAEPITPRAGLAAALILAGVLIINRAQAAAVRR